MKLAAIDIGSNSIHLVIVRAQPGQRLQIIDREKDMARLASQTLKQRRLAKETIDRAIVTLQRFKQIAEANRVDLIIATATSAVRESTNAREFIDRVRHEVGVEVELLPGVEEARLIALAVSEVTDFDGRRGLIIDIGGGSTEFVITDGREAQMLMSVRLGSVRLTERFITTDPISDREREGLVAYVRGELTVLLREVKNAGYNFVIGTSGTILALAGAIAAEDEAAGADTSAGVEPFSRTFSLKQLKRLNRRLTRMPLGERSRMAGLEKRRADIIVAGGLLLETILTGLGASEVTTCDWSLREGVILDYLSKRAAAESHPKAGEDESPDLRTRSVLSVARRFSYDAGHSHHVARLAANIFDETSPIHGMGDGERELLQFAALLHDVGHYIAHEDHTRHALYLIKNSDMPGFTAYEITVMGNMVRYLKGPVPKKSGDARSRREHEDLFAFDRDERLSLLRLAAILRIADALDRSRRQAVTGLRCKIARGASTFYLSCAGDCDLETWSADRKASWFRELFGLAVSFERE